MAKAAESVGDSRIRESPTGVGGAVAEASNVERHMVVHRVVEHVTSVVRMHGYHAHAHVCMKYVYLVTYVGMMPREIYNHST